MDLATLSKPYTAEGPFATIYLATESIRFARGGLEQSPAAGIGALLRFSTDPSTTA